MGLLVIRHSTRPQNPSCLPFMSPPTFSTSECCLHSLGLLFQHWFGGPVDRRHTQRGSSSCLPWESSSGFISCRWSSAVWPPASRWLGVKEEDAQIKKDAEEVVRPGLGRQAEGRTAAMGPLQSPWFKAVLVTIAGVGQWVCFNSWPENFCHLKMIIVPQRGMQGSTP